MQTSRKLAVTLLVALSSFVSPIRMAHAQDAEGALPRIFVGMGFGALTSDAASRMRLFDDPSPLGWFVEAGIGWSPRIGLGVEVSRPPSVSADTSGQSFRSTGRQEEVLAAALLRGRTLASRRWALDVVGGAGVLFQHHEQTFAPCFRGCEVIDRDALSRRAPAFIFGADLPFAINRHVSIGPVVRWYVLLRGEDISEDSAIVPWQYETHSSTRSAMSVSGRVVW